MPDMFHTHCHICVSMRKANPKKHGSINLDVDTVTCALCARDFCNAHKGRSGNTCEINHITYRARHPGIEGIYARIEDVPELEAGSP